MFSTVTTAEGGGWGVSVSTSVGVMHSSEMSSHSVTMTVGSAKELFRRTVTNFNVLKLNSASNSIINMDPELFIKTYGLHYISEVVYGGTFLGFQNLAQREDFCSDSLHIFAKVDVSKAFFSIGGSEDFTHSTSNYNAEMKLTYNIVNRGGPSLTGTGMTPVEMGW